MFHLYLKPICLEKDLFLFQHTEKVKNDSKECTPNPHISGSDVNLKPLGPHTDVPHYLQLCVGVPFQMNLSNVS